MRSRSIQQNSRGLIPYWTNLLTNVAILLAFSIPLLLKGKPEGILVIPWLPLGVLLDIMGLTWEGDYFFDSIYFLSACTVLVIAIAARWKPVSYIVGAWIILSFMLGYILAAIWDPRA